MRKGAHNGVSKRSLDEAQRNPGWTDAARIFPEGEKRGRYPFLFTSLESELQRLLVAVAQATSYRIDQAANGGVWRSVYAVSAVNGNSSAYAY